MKIIIAGSRSFEDWEGFNKIINTYTTIGTGDVIVSGCALGVDTLAIEYAKTNEIGLKTFPADWKTHKRSAGYIRNGEMAEYADYLIALWDGVSRGTKNIINQMELRKKPYTVIYV